MPKVERISENKPIFQIPPFQMGKMQPREKSDHKTENLPLENQELYMTLSVHENKVRNGSPSLCLNWV